MGTKREKITCKGDGCISFAAADGWCKNCRPKALTRKRTRKVHINDRTPYGTYGVWENNEKPWHKNESNYGIIKNAYGIEERGRGR